MTTKRFNVDQHNLLVKQFLLVNEVTTLPPQKNQNIKDFNESKPPTIYEETTVYEGYKLKVFH
jgi:hypothetical protein